MRLCFGSFCTLLLANRKNRSVSQEKICRDLFEMLSPEYAIGRTSSYLGLFVNREREIPSHLRSPERKPRDLSEDFEIFISENLTYDLTALMSTLRYLIAEDSFIGAITKKHLLKLSEQVEAASFLAKLFVFIVDHTDNKVLYNEFFNTTKTQGLLERIQNTDNNVTLGKLAIRAIIDSDYLSLEICLNKICNELYLARALIAIAQQENYDPSAGYDRIFHKFLTRLGNNKYRHHVMECCIEEGFFAEHPAALLDEHMGEYTNQAYVFKMLLLLYEKDMRDLAEMHRALLTHKTYKKRLDAFLEQQN